MTTCPLQKWVSNDSFLDILNCFLSDDEVDKSVNMVKVKHTKDSMMEECTGL